MKHKHEPNVPDHGGEGAPFDLPQGALRVAAIFAACLFVASHLVTPLVPVVLSQLLYLAAAISAGMAVLQQEPFYPTRLTRWDEAAILTGLALLAGFFVDPAAVQSTFTELGVQAPAQTTGQAS